MRIVICLVVAWASLAFLVHQRQQQKVQGAGEYVLVSTVDRWLHLNRRVTALPLDADTLFLSFQAGKRNCASSDPRIIWRYQLGQ